MWILYVLFFGVLAFLYVLFLVVVVPIVALFAAAVYGFGMPIAYVAGLGQVLLVRSPRLPEPRWWPRPREGEDPAVLGYFYGPAVADADHAVRVAFENCMMLWRLGIRSVRASLHTETTAPITAPIGLSAGAGMVLGGGFGALGAAACALAHLLVVGVSTAGVRAAGLTLRGADSALLRIRNIRMVCPNPACYERVPYPAYNCPGHRCWKRHHDVRPGRFGIVSRHCLCGTRMSTLLLFGSSRMNAFCPHKGCGQPLEHRPGKAPEIVLPFFGATGAGKTRLLLSMVTQLRRWEEEGLTVEFADSATARELDIADRVLRSGRATGKTSIAPPHAHVIRLSRGKDARILHMFDAAGEHFYRTDRTKELGYLSKARTFILVIDPLSVEAFWDQLPAGRRAELIPLRSEAPSPDLAYQQTHQEIEAMGVRLNRSRLAVVFSRADVVSAPDDDVERWAQDELGLGNMIRSTRQFKETGFFRTAAVMAADGGVHESVAVLTRWVLDGVQLPGGTP